LNAIIAGWFCIAIGAGITFAEPSTFALSISAPLSIGGIILLVIGISMESPNYDQHHYSSWAPERATMPDAGRAMYRIDSTLDEPIRTSVLCGRCANLEWIDGPKPTIFQCPRCNTILWDNEEE